jgi:hypothetical protein
VDNVLHLLLLTLTSFYLFPISTAQLITDLLFYDVLECLPDTWWWMATYHLALC